MRARRFSWKAALLGSLLHIHAAALAVLLLFLLPRAGLDFPSLHLAGVVGGAVGAWIELLLAATLVAGMLLAGAIAGLWAAAGSSGEATGPNDKAAAWNKATLTSALTINSFQLAQVFYGFSPGILLSLVATSALLLVVSRTRLPSPLILAGILPSLALAAWTGESAFRYLSQAARDHSYGLRTDTLRAAQTRDDPVLRKALGRVDPSFDSLKLARDLAWGGEYSAQGDYGPEIELLVRESKNTCLAGLRPLLDGDGIPPGQPPREDCALLATYLAARKNRPQALDWAVGLLASPRAKDQALRALLAAPDEEAALRFARAASWLDARGKLDPALYNDDFVVEVWCPAGRPEQQAFFWRHADLDALLVATIGFNGYTPPANRDTRGLLEHGAHINGKNPGGATPLTAFISTRNLDPVVLDFILKLGADPNLAGNPYARQNPAQALGSPKSPLWHLIERAEKTDQNSNDDKLFKLLLSAGADPGVARGFSALSPRTAGFLKAR